LALGSFLYTQLVQDDPIKKLVNESSEAREALSRGFLDNIESLKTTVEARHSSLEAQLQSEIKQRLKKAEEELQAGLETVTASKPTTPARWRLAEATYLVREANRGLVMRRDKEYALEALVAASQILQNLGDFAPYSLRISLSDNIASLQRIDTIDVEETYIRLETLKRFVPTGAINGSADSPSEVVSAATIKPWWQHVLDRLNNLIKISVLVEQSNSQARAKFRPSEEMVDLTNLQIGLAIDRAQLALLQRRPKLYRVSLISAKNAVLKQFGSSGLSETLFLRDVESLLGLELNPPLTDLQGTLTLISNLERGTQ
jgi:uncharacterized protein HemX